MREIAIVLANVGGRGSSTTCSHGRPNRRMRFWDAEKGQPGEKEFAKANEGFSAKSVTGMIVPI